MTQGAFRWNDIEVTWQDKAIDYYAVINGLRPGERAVPERTILFSLEPPVRGGGRRKPPVDPRPFLAVRDYRTHFPPLEWHLGQTYAELKAASPVKSRVLSAVVSSRHELPGHRKRLAFLRFLETRGVALDLYGYRNDAGLASYVGPLPIHRKDDGILPYRYTFNAENQAAPNYCTEKLGTPSSGSACASTGGVRTSTSTWIPGPISSWISTTSTRAIVGSWPRSETTSGASDCQPSGGRSTGSSTSSSSFRPSSGPSGSTSGPPPRWAAT